ncbi:23S rRNA (adenine(2503)-C(2))-methyltransferase RlmN [Acetonema longum]|uniref:Probable dual-specificity RNA methyltransferase RlmN n=1 Tax=Acetonema longum DSM 6540 TaxID=1009370 RepID=F7NLE7_9FIRM|nr:23S rRNA (adenine(2503)-C(2))-methyltransferase RlmN [Acetonema longum]EGO63252.1 Ribosomal RNA large subunit methyltransferase N [Acetonema longum DSM 6540]
MTKPNIYGLFLPELKEKMTELGIESYRGAQIAEWIYKRGVKDFNLMSNLPQRQRQLLQEHFYICTPEILGEQHSADSQTSKLLMAFEDSAAIETVLMRQSYGNSVCVSTQVGCAMGCAFCASTLHGFSRNLSGGEILAQVLYLNEWLQSEEEKVDSIVIMGIGEPLANYHEVLRFIKLCHEPYCLNMSYRNITLSTSGLVPAIRQLAEEKIPITLAISLHAANDALRSQLMPVNHTYPIEQLLSAADYYADQTSRRVTYEYLLIAGINDTMQHAKELAGLLHKRLAAVNLIPVNSVLERGWARPADKKIREFEAALKTFGVNVTVRREMGADISAACGQLRNKRL